MRYINFDNIPENREWAFESVRSTEQWQRGGTAKRWCRLHYRTVRYVGSINRIT